MSNAHLDIQPNTINNEVRSANTDLGPGFDEFINKVPVAVYTCYGQGYITSYNKAAEQLWEKAPKIGEDQWCGSFKIFLPNGKPIEPDECPMARTLKDGIAIDGEEIIIERPGGSRVNVLAYPTPLFDNNGVLTGAVNTLINITEQKKQEKLDSLLVSIIESSDDAIISKTTQGIITSFNRGAENLFGYSSEEMIGKPVTVLIPSDRLDEEREILRKIRNKEKVEHYETIRIRKDGVEIPVSLTISPVKDAKGNVTGASKIARDISKQKLAEDKLQRYSERLQILNSIDKMISENLEMKDIIQKVTDATTKLTGADFGAFFFNLVDKDGESYMLYTLSGVSRDAFKDFPMPRNTSVFHPTFSGESTVRSGNITEDTRYGKNAPYYGMPKGHLPVVSYLAVPVQSNSGQVLGGLFYGHHEKNKFTEEHEHLVTAIATQTAFALENARLYEKTLQLNSQKDEFIGLASHELKTPLTSLLGYLQIMESNFEPGDENKFFISKALQQAKKLSRLVADLLDVSKIEAGKLPFTFSYFDVVAMLKDAIELMQYSTRSHHIELNTSIEQLTVLADKQRIEQVVINFISNALKFSYQSDTVKVMLNKSEKELVIAVQDFGIGIQQEMFDNIFSKFYRIDDAPDSIAGLGIGLYISKEIITRHNGKIWVESEPDKGSVFYFSLPLPA